MDIAWLSDVHLNFVSQERARRLCEPIRRKADAVLISGDIAEAPTVVAWLKFLESELQRPIYFVLGNHDYYAGWRDEVHAAVRTLCRRSLFLNWLEESGVIALSDNTALVGVGGWADGGYGDYHRSGYEMSDYTEIADLRGLDVVARLPVIQSWSREGAARLEATTRHLSGRGFERLVITTHVPPFREVCLYQGRLPSAATAPHYASETMGQALLRIAAANPSMAVDVLCGHSHEAAEFHPLPNLCVKSARATYGSPELQGWLEVAGKAATEPERRPMMRIGR